MFTDRPELINGRELNVIVENEFMVGDEDQLFFDGEPVWKVIKGTDMFDLLVTLGAFTSKSQARKNWMRTGKKIPPGFNDFTDIGRLRRRLTIFNPTAEYRFGD